jgi:cellulose biosynthesis protein BcsQ
MASECYVVAFVSGKGGTGKTTLTANFAVELASAARSRGGDAPGAKNRVLVIDNDYATGGASYLLAGGERLRSGAEREMIRASSCFYDCYAHQIPPEQVTPLRLLFEHPSVGEFQVDVLLNSLAWWKAPLPDAFGEEESLEIALEATAEGFIDRHLLPYYEAMMERFRGEYDYILIDSRGGADTRASVAAVVADSIVIVTEPGDVAGKQDMSFVHSLRGLAEQIGHHVGGVSVIYNRVLGTDRNPSRDVRASELAVIGRLPISETVVQCYRNTELVFERKPLDPFCIEAVRAFEARFPGEVGLCQLRRKRALALLGLRQWTARTSAVLAHAAVFLAVGLGTSLVFLRDASPRPWWIAFLLLVLASGGILVSTSAGRAAAAERTGPRVGWIVAGAASLILLVVLAWQLGPMLLRPAG